MYALREPPRERASSPARARRTRPEPAERDEAQPWLACVACGAFVALAEDRIEVDGAHAHTFINPAGLIFRVGCFARAAGAMAWGPASTHWTWFAGFAWQLGACRRCGGHLGWTYTASGTSFVALILDRIVERDGPMGPGAPLT